jgi:hypothetical protein
MRVKKVYKLIKQWCFDPTPNDFTERYKLTFTFSSVHYICFIIFLLISYVVTCFFATGMGHFIKSTDLYYHYDNFFCMIIFASLPYFLCEFAESFTWFTACVCFVSIFVYGYIANVPSLNIALLPVTAWTTDFTILMTFTLMSLVLFLIWTCVYAVNHKVFKRYLFVISLPCFYIIMALVLYYLQIYINGNMDKEVYHLHHATLSYIFLFLCFHPNNLSRVFLGISLSIFINGFALFGIGSIFVN